MLGGMVAWVACMPPVTFTQTSYELGSRALKVNSCLSMLLARK